MYDFVTLVPSPFWLRLRFINKDALSIRNVERLEFEFPHDVNKERRSHEHLPPCDLRLANQFAKRCIVGRRVILAVKFKEISNVRQFNRTRGIAQAPKDLRDLGVDVASCPRFEEAISYRSHKNFTYSSRAECSSRESFSTDSDRAANFIAAF